MPDLHKLTAQDLAGAAELECLCFDEPWSENALSLLCGGAATGYAVTEGGEVLAYGGMFYVPDEGQITNIAVRPDARRKGFAKTILRALFADAAEHGLGQISLEVRASNQAAISLYVGEGFAEAGRRRHFYKNPPEDAVVMIAPVG